MYYFILCVFICVHTFWILHIRLLRYYFYVKSWITWFNLGVCRIERDGVNIIPVSLFELSSMKIGLDECTVH